MGTLKITSWNVEYLDRLTKPDINANQQKRRDAVVREIREISPDILLLLEGPASEEGIDTVSTELLGGDWVPVKAADGEYATRGTQWIWFLVRKNLAEKTSLLPAKTWDVFAGESWKCNYWGEFNGTTHRHYRHPQVLVLDSDGFRVEFIGLHLKSKFVNGGKSKWDKGGASREGFIREALTARIKLSTEAANVRNYIDKKFEQVEKPAIFIMGDFNDGPGKEYFEERFLFFDLISSLQGEVFFATRFLNHALFDYPDELRWTVDFDDFVKGDDIPARDPHILLDHILFTQGLVDGSLPWKINPKAGTVEHEIHHLINAPLSEQAKTSDHTPVSLIVSTTE